MAAYPGRHWRGDLSLAAAFWGSILSGGLIAAAAGLAGWLVLRGLIMPWGVLLLVSANWGVRLLVAVWQVVGVWRSASRHASRGGRRFWAVLVKVLLVLGVVQTGWLVASRAVPELREAALIAAGDPSVGGFEIQVLNHGRELAFTGGIPFGATRALQKALAAAPDVRVVHLTSQGGRIVEARHMRDLLRSRGLWTFVPRRCLSACTLAFLGGARRFITSAGGLGFHAGHFPGVTGIEQAAQNAAMEQDALQAGVSPAFARRAYGTATAAMWFPTATELLESHFATDLDAGQFALSGLGAHPSREDVVAALRAAPLFDAIAAADPARFATMVDGFAADLAAGTQTAVAEARLRGVTGLVLRDSMPRASDAALRLMAEALLEDIAAIGPRDPDACHDFLSADPTHPADVDRFISPMQEQRTNAAVEAIIRSAIGAPPRHPPDAAIQAARERLLAVLRQRYPPAVLRQLTQFGTPQLPRADTCRVAQIVFRETLALPDPDGAVMLRAILGGDAKVPPAR
ncbi:MAG: hypothetical protein J0H67_05830 [Rhodospirillales bacterium]|nr:hypothetical protein [Rhodospirillales bacterium]